MGSIWELDFYSRPIVDEQGKKVWEILVCESPLDTRRKVDSLFHYSQYCPSSQVNSVWLGTALMEAISQAKEAPIRIRFFRRQMSNMIIKAGKDLGIPVQPSRRTLVLNQWLQQRMESVYPHEPGYQEVVTNPSVRVENPVPQRLPDALAGQEWGFVTLNAVEFTEMHEWEIGFGEAFPLEMAQVSPETPIPGIVIFSPRALPLAAWLSGLELAWVRFDSTEGAKLLLESGAIESWILANIANPQILTEAEKFEKAKQKAHGVHFIAVQSDPQAESFAGFWLLQEVNLA
ncbi:MAG: Tab2/Atab2 family RNA-binding protein [Rhizonema sp. NSF051]|nr:Tab2/Atab2 family RNA-binding protein [Rhizonema sp. NSF051]